MKTYSLKLWPPLFCFRVVDFEMRLEKLSNGFRFPFGRTKFGMPTDLFLPMKKRLKLKLNV